MRFPDDTPVTTKKLDELRARVKALGIDLAQVEEKAVKGGGRGGQKVNKTSSAVQLTLAPQNIVVRCQKTRSRAMNRFFALRLLCDAVARQRPRRASNEPGLQ